MRDLDLDPLAVRREEAANRRLEAARDAAIARAEEAERQIEEHKETISALRNQIVEADLHTDEAERRLAALTAARQPNETDSNTAIRIIRTLLGNGHDVNANIIADALATARAEGAREAERRVAVLTKAFIERHSDPTIAVMTTGWDVSMTSTELSGLLASAHAEGAREATERAAAKIEGYSVGQIKMACGEMTAQEVQSVKAVQRWFAAAIRGGQDV